jgi:hypothetical protein
MCCNVAEAFVYSLLLRGQSAQLHWTLVRSERNLNLNVMWKALYNEVSDVITVFWGGLTSVCLCSYCSLYDIILLRDIVFRTTVWHRNCTVWLVCVLFNDAFLVTELYSVKAVLWNRVFQEYFMRIISCSWCSRLAKWGEEAHCNCFLCFVIL